MDGCGAAPDVGAPFIDQFSPDLPIVHEVVVCEEARRRVEDEGTEADDESEIISVGGPLSIFGGCESEGVTVEKTIGRAGLNSEKDCFRYSWTTNLLVLKLLNNHYFLSGFHIGQLFHPLS